jgi:hypothetical protein
MATVDANNKISYTGDRAGIDTITYSVTCGTEVSEAKVYVTVGAVGSAFVDDVWYFGQNLAGASPAYKSAGIRFVKDGSGNYIPQDASGESNVYSWENSLVVSSPYCDGQNIFYSSHNQLYNSLHEPMKNGTFSGHTSVADGLAACYMGNNKYLFFTVTTCYDSKKELRAYVVDMNGDNGKGERISIPNELIETSSYSMSESIDLIARAGTTSQYWLVYAHRSDAETANNYSNELRVRLVDVSDPDNPSIGPIHSRVAKADSRTFSMASSQQHDRIAITDLDVGIISIFDFDNSTGTISARSTISGFPIYLYGIEFSPDGNQLYFAKFYLSDARLYQYDISGATPVQVTGSPLQFWSQTVHNYKGSGLKLGPDDRIYVTQSYTNKLGVISDPNATTSLASRYNIDGFTMSNISSYDGLQFSEGLTKPAIMSCNMNNAPTTQDDATTLCVSSTSRTTKVNVLKNDADVDNNKIYLTNAEFVNSADATLADIAVNATDSTITLTLKNDVSVTAGHVFEIIYDVKDNGLPASQCATGKLRITASSPPNYPDLRIRVCPDAGNVNLAKYIDTTDNVSAIQWAGQIPDAISSDGVLSTSNLASSRVFTFTYTITSQCVVDQKRKVYIEVIKNGNVHRLRDTIVICNEYADAVQINQLFGIEADNGTWSYYSHSVGDINAYVTESHSSAYNGAVVLDGKALYEDDDINSVKYHGIDVKKAVFTYTPASGSCLTESYKIVIVLTPNLLN